MIDYLKNYYWFWYYYFSPDKNLTEELVVEMEHCLAHFDVNGEIPRRYLEKVNQLSELLLRGEK